MNLTPNEKAIIVQTVKFVKTELAHAEGGHDWWHVYRVWKMACRIAAAEQVNLFVVELAALLHDIADPKFHDGNENTGPELAATFLDQQQVDHNVRDHVVNIIRNMSFKNSLGTVVFNSPEMEVVQDADRLDAIGAIGIARTFNYGGFKNRVLYDPGIPPKPGLSKEAYKNSSSPTINHFYEKLLLLKDRMNTRTGKQLAETRHHFMEIFLEHFYAEWEGKQ